MASRQFARFRPRCGLRPCRRPALTNALALLRLQFLEIRNGSLQAFRQRHGRSSSSCAWLISGRRCFGSSCGSGRWTIRDREPVMAITFSASSRIVNSFGVPGSRSSRGGAGDLLHSVHRLPVAGFAARFPAVLDGAGLFLRLARQRQVAEDRTSLGPAGATQAWA